MTNEGLEYNTLLVWDGSRLNRNAAELAGVAVDAAVGLTVGAGVFGSTAVSGVGAEQAVSTARMTKM